jgi:hypothetical protein
MFLSFSDSYASDLTWKQAYSVSEGEVWIIKWFSPYETYEIRPMYDLRLIFGEHQILAHCCLFSKTVTVGSDLHIDFIANYQNRSALLRVEGPALLSTANDITKFTVEKFDR